jgi:hypothetical protein
MHDADIVMLESRSGLCLVDEALFGVFVTRKIGGEEFEGYCAFELGVLGAIHHAHASCAKLFKNLVV